MLNSESARTNNLYCYLEYFRRVTGSNAYSEFLKEIWVILQMDILISLEISPEKSLGHRIAYQPYKSNNFLLDTSVLIEMITLVL